MLTNSGAGSAFRDRAIKNTDAVFILRPFDSVVQPKRPARLKRPCLSARWQGLEMNRQSGQRRLLGFKDCGAGAFMASLRSRHHRPPLCGAAFWAARLRRGGGGALDRRTRLAGHPGAAGSLQAAREPAEHARAGARGQGTGPPVRPSGSSQAKGGWARARCRRSCPTPDQ